MEKEGHAAERCPGRDVDDDPSPTLAERRHGRAAGEEHRRDVDVHHAAPLVQRDLREGPHRQRGVEARVVDEDVETAAPLDRLHGHPLDLGLLGNVDGESDTAGIRLGGTLGALQVGDDDPRALCREAVRDRLADPLGRARDERDLPLERAHGTVSTRSARTASE